MARTVFKHLTVAIAALTLAPAAPALAADLGGDCCADLEERIAELEATTARKGNRKVSLTVFGQVNHAIMWWDDSRESNTYVVNNKTSTSRVGFEGAATISPDIRAGFFIELEASSANSDFNDQGRIPLAGGGVINGFGDNGSNPSGAVVLRHSNWWLEHKRLGRFTLGRQSNATDNIAEMDLSRTSAVSISSVETWNEGFFLRSANDGLAVTVPGILFVATGGAAPVSIMGDLWRGNFDGGRGNFARYDSPVVGGFILSATWGEDDDWAVGLRYGGEINGFAIRGGIGYQNGKTIDSDALTTLVGGAGGFQAGVNLIPEHEEVVGSLSILHQQTGLFLTLAGGSRNWLESPMPGFSILDDKYFYVKAGLLRRFNHLGDTAIYGEYYKIWDVGLDAPAIGAALNNRLNEEAETYGVGVVQHIDNAAMELYLAYRHYRADDVTDIGLGFTDHNIRFDTVMGGARIQF